VLAERSRMRFMELVISKVGQSPEHERLTTSTGDGMTLGACPRSMSLGHLLRWATLLWSGRCEGAMPSVRTPGSLVPSLDQGFRGACWILIVLVILRVSTLTRQIL
jgi:hypothetical protein